MEIIAGRDSSENNKAPQVVKRTKFFGENPIIMSRFLENITDRAELKKVVDDMEDDARLLQIPPEKYFTRFISISKIRNLSARPATPATRSEEHTSELQSPILIARMPSSA